LTLAADFDLRELGMLYYVAASSKQFGEALERLDRYIRLGNEALDIHVNIGPICRVGLTYSGVPRHLDRHQMEFLALTFLRLCRQLVGRQIMPISASFTHHRSGDLSGVQRCLGCLPEFGASADEMSFERALFDAELVGADPFLSELILKNCEEAMATRPSTVSRFRTLVEDKIARLLPHAEARAATVARQTGLSERTFARRLQAEGITFEEILDALRRDLAVRYLEEPKLQISEIAWLLGFQQPSAFSRACRRWVGRSPLEYRRARLAI
jgi:AraC-like DNA-binding protein